MSQFARSRRSFARWLPLAVGAMLCAQATASELRDIRVWDGPQNTRVVFDLSGASEHTLFTLDNPERVVIDLRGKSSICDQMVVASGRAQRHVAAMAEHLAEELKPHLGHAPAIEGLPAGDWVLLDAGDVIVHLFRPEVRAFYNLEKMWGVELAEAAADRSTGA